MSFILGITGGIATGKSTVVNFFKEFGFPVVDGDLVARKVVEPERPALQDIVKHFGNQVLMEDGRLNRKKIGQLVFSNEEQRNMLNRILESYIRQEIDKQIEEAKKISGLVIVDIPLLFEADYQQSMDAVAVVYLPMDKQIERLMKRDGFSRALAVERIETQWSIEKKKQLADLVFDNQGTVTETREQVLKWLKHSQFI